LGYKCQTDKQLSKLDATQLNDIGFSQFQATNEAGKAFWE
jgi:uncharacterized protein YjiS (DUF1127 family)